MHSGLLLVVLATAVTATLGQYCKDVSWGTMDGEGLEKQIVYLSPGIRAWEVDIPTTPPCTHVYGIFTTICDYDVVPDGYYKNRNQIIVNRNGDLLGQASAQATVYCDQ